MSTLAIVFAIMAHATYTKPNNGLWWFAYYVLAVFMAAGSTLAA